MFARINTADNHTGKSTLHRQRGAIKKKGSITKAAFARAGSGDKVPRKCKYISINGHAVAINDKMYNTAGYFASPCGNPIFRNKPVATESFVQALWPVALYGGVIHWISQLYDLNIF